MPFIRKLQEALSSIPAGWLVVILLGFLFGLSQLNMLPLELGFAGSAALVLAGYFVMGDLFLWGKTKPLPSSNLPLTSNPRTQLSLVPAALVAIALVADGIFIGSVALYQLKTDRISFLSRNQAGELKVREDMRQGFAVTYASPARLARSTRPDSEVNSIWVDLESDAGKKYIAVHSFDDGMIMLISRDKDIDDFKLVMKQLETLYDGTESSVIRDLDFDFTQYIGVPQGFTQKDIADKVESGFGKGFRKSRLNVVYYHSD